MFVNELKNELNKKMQETENGALGFATSGKNLVDINFRVSSYRNMSEDEIFNDFILAYNDDPVMAMRWLFYARDVRGGLGERRLFRAILENLVKGEPELVEKILPLVAAFGRWDDLFIFMNTSLEKNILKIIAKQLALDIENKSKGLSISLLAKWMPSANASSAESRKLALKIANRFGLSERNYRKTLSMLRTHLNIVEQKMSARDWEAIDYEAVPSRANLIYNGAFLKHDEYRRREFLGAVEKGEAKINSSVNFPHDILAKYNSFRRKDQTLEVLWKALPNFGNLENTLVVADGSGSMGAHVGNTSIRALDVANALAIYFAEHCEGGFKNNYITFSETPQLVNLGNGSLFSKKEIAERHCEVANTNIQAVFELILKTAINREMKQEELPATILIISDMEFDACTSSDGWGWRPNRSIFFTSPDKTLFAKLGDKFADYGYKLPRLAFWNVMSSTLTIPVQQNDAGVVLVSGFSPSAVKMVLSGKTDPYEALVEILKDPRYDVVEQALA